ncbi:MAG: ATP phosphoribosyltransferase [Thermoanaerobaculia bacterium]|nr:ATP phosphoribosyltransferase [Thermoanaerobaculia bacterium]
MILALPKGRNLKIALQAFRAAGLPLDRVPGGLEEGDRRLRVDLPDAGFQILLLKDWDVPLYVEYGIADVGIVGSDVLAEVGGDVLVPARFTDGRCRLSLVGRNELPAPGAQVRLASKFTNIAHQVVADEPWNAEILKLFGSVELGPLLELSEVALDIVQTGRTLKENHLRELKVVREVAPLLLVHRAAFQRHRERINDLVDAFEAAGVVDLD